MKKLYVWIFLVVFFLFPSILMAAGLVPCGKAGDKDICTLCDLIALAQNLLNLFVKVIMWYIALFSIMYAGFLIMTDKSKKQGYDLIKKVLIGIVIILLAWTIINTLIYILAPKALDESGQPLLKSWNKIQCQEGPVTIQGNGDNFTPGGGEGGGGSGGGFN